MMETGEKYPIDAVVTWVDGDDPRHRAKRFKYSGKAERQNDEVGGEVRFKSIGEIKYCVASLFRFAPFLRKVFIVTDGQDPHIEDFIRDNFPDSSIGIEIVDHREIYRGHEDMLPVFNSLSIETALWRIPGLSENFIYLNDDVMLVAPTMPEDFFPDGKIACYASRFSLPFAKFIRAVKPKRNGFKIFGFKDAMINAADLIGEKWNMLYIGHTPHILKISVLEEFFSEHPDAMLSNMRPRFREPFQFNPQELCYLLALRSGECIVRSRKGMDLYVKPKDRPGYMASKLAGFDRCGTALFACFNSLCYASGSDRALALRWIRNRLGVDEEAESEK